MQHKFFSKQGIPKMGSAIYDQFPKNQIFSEGLNMDLS